MKSERVNERDLEWVEDAFGEGHAWKRKRLSLAAGAHKLGCSLYELPPRKRPWPYHYHVANEEAIYVLSGSGRLSTPAGEMPLCVGDYVVLPAGEEGAHELLNTGDEPLRFLFLSTMIEPDITVQPRSGKLGVFGGSAPGGDPNRRTVGGFFHRDAAVEYWEGEE